jgi:hypothetical protein
MPPKADFSEKCLFAYIILIIRSDLGRFLLVLACARSDGRESTLSTSHHELHFTFLTGYRREIKRTRKYHFLLRCQGQPQDNSLSLLRAQISRYFVDSAPLGSAGARRTVWSAFSTSTITYLNIVCIHSMQWRKPRIEMTVNMSTE